MYKFYYNINMSQKHKHIHHKKTGHLFRRDFYIASWFIDVMAVLMVSLIVTFSVFFGLTMNYYWLAMALASTWYLNTIHNYRKYVFMNQKGLLNHKHKNEFMVSAIHKYGIRYDYGLLPKMIIIAIFQWTTVFGLIYPLFIPLGEFEITEVWHILVITFAYVSWGGLFLIIWIEFRNAYHEYEVEHLNDKGIIKYIKMFHAYWIFGNMWNIMTDYEFYIKGNEKMQPDSKNENR